LAKTATPTLGGTVGTAVGPQLDVHKANNSPLSAVILNLPRGAINLILHWALGLREDC